MTTLEKLQWLVMHSSDGVALEWILLIGDDETESKMQIAFRKGPDRFCFCGNTVDDAIDKAYDHLNKP